VPRVVPIRGEDPAGRLDVLLVNLAREGTRWGERKLAACGVHVNLWDGTQGLGAVIEEVISRSGIPRESIIPPALKRRLTGKRRRVA